MSIDITAVDRKEQREETNTDEDEGARTDGGQRISRYRKRREVEIIAECASPALQQRRVDASNSSSEKK